MSTDDSAFSQSKESSNTYSDKISPLCIDITNQEAFIYGKSVEFIEASLRYTIAPSADRLVKQAVLNAQRIRNSSIDPNKYVRTRNESKGILLLAKTYIYSYFKAVFCGIKYPNVQFGNNDLFFMGHFDLLKAMNSRSVVRFKDDAGNEVIRRIELSKLDDMNLDVVMRTFPFLKGCIKKEDKFRFYHDEFEGVLERLKELAVTHKSPYGFQFQLKRANKEPSLKYDVAKDFPIGNCALALDNQDVLLFPISSDVKLQDTDVIINSGLFITLSKESYKIKGVSLDHSVYRRFDISDSNHLIPLEVEAITGQPVAPCLDESMYDIVRDLIYLANPKPNRPNGNGGSNNDGPESDPSGDSAPSDGSSDDGGGKAKKPTP